MIRSIIRALLRIAAEADARSDIVRGEDHPVPVKDPPAYRPPPQPDPSAFAASMDQLRARLDEREPGWRDRKPSRNGGRGGQRDGGRSRGGWRQVPPPLAPGPRGARDLAMRGTM